MAALDWADLPDITEVRDTMKRHAHIKAEIRLLELQLEMVQAEMAELKPRNTAVRVIGVDDASRNRLTTLRESVARAKNVLDDVAADLDFLEYRKEAAKIMSYKGRV